MQSKSGITQEIEFVRNLKVISQSYQEISVMKIHRIREKVVKTREFIDSIQDVFTNVKTSYRKRMIEILAEAKKKKIKDLKKNKYYKKFNNEKDSELVVFISANSKLYGDIVSKVFEDFLNYVDKHNCEIMIIGQLGKELWYEVHPDKEIMYVEFTEADFKSQKIDTLIETLYKFTKINVFHGQYESIINQSPIMSNISGNSENLEEDINNPDKTAFLFEPSVEELAEFFEKQVIASLMKQSIHESELSLHASRIKSMELALNAMDKKERSLILEDLRFRNNLYNKNQQTSLLGVSIWKHN